MKIEKIMQDEDGRRLLVVLAGGEEIELANGDQVLISGTGIAGLDGYHKVEDWKDEDLAFTISGQLEGDKDEIRGGELQRIGPDKDKVAAVTPAPIQPPEGDLLSRESEPADYQDLPKPEETTGKGKKESKKK